jgi:enoyl-CoA hydratase
MSGGSIGVTELLVGVPFPTAPLEVMRHAAGPAVDELVLSGRLLDAAAAQRCGLVHEVVAPDALLGEAIRRAQWLGRIPASVYASTKEQLHRPTRQRISANQEVDDARVRAAWQDPQTLATMRRFVERLTAASSARAGA